MPTDSFAILLTPPGAAAIAVVRLTGPNVSSFIESHFSRPVPAGKCVHGTLADAGGVLDDPVVVLSGSGETADINVHGGPWVVRSVVALAERAGFRIREAAGAPLPGEAVDADSPLERDVLRCLPAAATELAIGRLLGQPAAWRTLRGRIDRNEPAAIADELAAMRADSSLFHLLHPPRVAIVGVPNGGKSTLANALFAQERSITADLPGTTRDWVGEMANLDGLAVMLVDTPGIRVNDDSIEARAIERAREEISAADLVVLVLDPTQPLEGGQAELLERFPTAVRVVNKADRAAGWDVDGVDGLRTVATAGAGVEALRKAIGDRFYIGGRAADAARWWTHEQREAIGMAEADPAGWMRWIDSQLDATRARGL